MRHGWHGQYQRRPMTRSGDDGVLTFADVLPPAEDDELDMHARRELQSESLDVRTHAALMLASHYWLAGKPTAARVLLRVAASGPPLTAGRALLRLARFV